MAEPSLSWWRIGRAAAMGREMTAGLDETGQYSDSELTKRWMEQLKDSCLLMSVMVLLVRKGHGAKRQLRQTCRFVSPKENRLPTGLEKSLGSSKQFKGVGEQERQLEL
ncbi:hypothetical protein Pcinc_031990 [Petrolisthes cinctipes]|uniref:Uncharacterized protein n=1 Tax=Petrolisthes cinctipes TaxID=88211 RepID=A0AAE1EV02_PETCI|nr:hypothetical protein Pcinc_031990 [Petrolisthes cinctipes]